MDVSKHSISSWVYAFEQQNNLELGTSVSDDLEDYIFNQMVTRKDKPTVVCNTPVYKTDTTYEEVIGQILSDYFKMVKVIDSLQEQRDSLEKVVHILDKLD